MEKINVLIVEDQQLIAEAIRSAIIRNGMSVSGVVSTGEEALQLFDRAVPDLVLMDIALAGALDGIATAKLMMDKREVPIIYLSDFVDDATVGRATKTRPVNYLAKPFQERDVIRAIQIAVTNFMTSPRKGNSVLSDQIFVKDQAAYVKVPYDRIIYLEAERSYCKIVTEEKSYLHSDNLSNVAEQIMYSDFVRIHRSYVINVNKITSIEGNIVRLGKFTVEMSKGMREDLLARIPFLK